MNVSTPGQLDSVLARTDANQPAGLARLTDFLRIPSVSTDPAFAKEVRRAGQWASDMLKECGFESRLVDTHGHPMVLAKHPGPKGVTAPRVLFYGHYDVQPADPIELWKSPPFEPAIVEGPTGKRIVARGAVDDKGQVMTFLEALRAWHTCAGGPPCPVTVILEGEEESGSESLEPFMTKYAKELDADIAIVSDTGMWDIDTPAITTMLRGLVYIEARLKGPSHDLHSGLYGGSLSNPINALARMIASLHHDDGRIAIEGFYDLVKPLPDRIKAQWAKLGFNESEFLAAAGVSKGFGEPGFSAMERTWCRPTCDCNGIKGGYQGEGAKTVIACEASAKISCRLVADMDPEVAFKKLSSHLQARVPAGYTLEIKAFGKNPPIRVKDESPYLSAAERGLKKVYGKNPVCIGSGGSIPAVGSIQRILGVESLLVGFGLDDDRVHSPNEKFELSCFRRGALSHAAILAELAGLRP
ncbi:MAG: dipeptidase [Planctomycetes bacterium]|nr:dipeptidase [Planctomycetota bacterium]